MRLTFWDRHNKAERIDISVAEDEEEIEERIEKQQREEVKDGEVNPAFTGSQDLTQGSSTINVAMDDDGKIRTATFCTFVRPFVGVALVAMLCRNGLFLHKMRLNITCSVLK